MPSLHHPSKRGFTLTELTVVVLIVFVLGMVLFPVFTKRRGSRQSSCASNQKQIALGFLQYIQDYDEHFPPATGYVDLRKFSPPPTTPPYVLAQSWGPDRRVPGERIAPGLLSPYIKSDQIFIDPGDNPPQGDRYTSRPKTRRFALYYMYNDLLIGIDQSSISAVASTVLMTDAEDRFGNAGHALAVDSEPDEAKFDRKGRCITGEGASVGKARFRHTQGAYFSFTDGHVKWFKGGTDDRVFFPPRESDSISAVDARTKRQIGPKPGTDMVFQGREYDATFHVR